MLPIDHNAKVLMLDNSAVETFTICPRKALYSIMGQRRSARPQAELRFGGHLHAALAYRYRCEALGLPWSEGTQMRILDRRFCSTPCEDEEWRNLGTAQKVISKYNLHWSHDPVDILRHNGRPIVEMPFAVFAGRINGWDIYYIGKIDLGHRTDGIIVRDHKTTSMLGNSFWRDAAVSPQTRGYLWALRTILGEEPLGYEINVLATRAPSKTGTPIEFARRTYYTRGQLDEWHSHFLAKAEYFLWLLAKGQWPKHEAMHCVHKYGTCEFYQVCELPASQREAMLASTEYTNNTWTPLYK